MSKQPSKAKRICYLLFGLFLVFYLYSNSPNLNPLYAEGAMFWCMLVSFFVALNTFFEWGGSVAEVFTPDANGEVHLNRPNPEIFKGMKKTNKYILIGVWGAFVLMILFSSVIINWKSYRDQLGDPEVKTFSSDVQPVDTTQIPIVDSALALKLADKKLGEKPSLGSQVTLGTPTIQMVNDQLLWVVPLEHSGFFKWVTNMSGTPGYITVSATNVNDVQYIEDHAIKYHPTSYFFHDLERYVRFSSALFTGITDYSFEIDNEGQPYWVITTYKNLRGFALPEATGVIIVNATTGHSDTYSLEEIPDWVDRVQPTNFIIQQIYNKGEYVHGFLNFSDKDKYMPSQGSNIIYNNGNCYLFTGLTSVGNDESAIGFIMVDMVTKEPILYQMNGATENSARSSAQGKVQHLGYTATFPIIMNVGDQPSYFMTLKDQEGLIKQYAFVSVQSYSTVGTGETMAEALRDYTNALSQIGMSGDLSGVQGEEKTVTATVLRIESQYDGTQTQYYLLLDSVSDKILVVNAVTAPEIVLTQSGDRVTVSYYDSGSSMIAVSGFDNRELDIN